MRKLAIVNRRYLRIKAFQALYAHYRSDSSDLQKVERGLFESVNNLYNLYLHLIKLVMDMHTVAEEIIETNRNKKLPTQEDINPNLRFVQNGLFKSLNENIQLKHLLEKSKISWDNEHDDLRRIYKQFRESDAFRLYLAREDHSVSIDRGIVEVMFREYIAVSDVIHSALEENDMFWRDDLPFAAIAVIKTIEAMPESTNESSSILPDLYKNKEDDQRFVKELLRKTVEFDEEYEGLIASKAKNWETDRIALIDMLLMKMALCELEHFATVPVKVSLNEYIELAKMYSTPKSKLFINGVLDKLVAEFKKNGRIEKRGRGLNE